MSLVITSNTPKNDVGTLTDGINRAYSYTNHLQGTLEIKKDSQIAVQSVKINKSGNVMLNESNTKFGFYYGRQENEWIGGYPDPDDPTVIQTSDIFNNSLMIPAFIVGEEDRQRNFSMPTDIIAERIQNSFNKVTNCPNLCQTVGIASGVENPGTLVTAKRDNTGQGFTGFKIDIQETLNASCVLTSTTWKNFGEGEGADAPVVSGPGFVITNPSTTEEICVVGTQYPLSLNGGRFNCSLGTHVPTPGDLIFDFSIGLSRCNGLEDVNTIEASGVFGTQEPNYWDNRGTSEIFFDWRIASVESTLPDHLGRHEIRVYHSVCLADGDGTPGNNGTFTEVEFEYWNDKDGPRAPFDGNGNNGMIWEDEEFEAVKFHIRNERVEIICEGSAGNKIICTGVQGGGDSGGDQTMKPVCPTTRWLFPKMILSPTKEFQVMEWNGVPVKDFEYGLCQNLNWYTQRTCDGDPTECQELDEELVYEYQSDDTLVVSDLFYNQYGLVGNFMDYELRLVTAPHYRYYLGQIGLNSQFILGFQRNTNAPPISGDLGVAQNKVFQSSSVPDLVSKQSIFIRIKNLPINSANFSKSAMSNILYHVPTFSNSGAETGSLHFEPNEMVYLNLNNTEPIYISTMEVDLVYGDETLCVDLSGKSVVVFHVRDKK